MLRLGKKLIGCIRFFLNGKNGFSLLEVLVATVVMTAPLVALLVAHSASIRNFTRSKMLTHASLMAESRMEQVEALGFGEPRSEKGEDEEHSYLFWQEEVVPVIEEVMLKAEVRVGRTQGGPLEGEEQEGVDLVSYIVNLKFGEEEEGEKKGDEGKANNRGDQEKKGKAGRRGRKRDSNQ